MSFNALWYRLQNWGDARQPRERLMLLLVAVLVVVALADAVWLAPALKRLALAQDKAKQQAAALARLQAQATLQMANKNGQTPAAQLETVNAKISQLEQSIRALAPNGRSVSALRRVLEAFLQRQDGLQLVRTSTLSTDSATTTSSALSAVTGAVSGMAGTDRRGLELTVAGTYPELARYVANLERAMPDLRWGSVLVSNQDSGTQLTLQVFVLENSP